MTSTPAISPTLAPAESAPSAAGNGPDQGFASALSGADAKPAPKSPHAKAKTAAPTGVPLPFGGIVSPPSAPVNPFVEVTAGAAGKALPAAAVAAAVLQHDEADTAPAAPVIAPLATPPPAAPPKAAAAVLQPAPTLDAVGSAAGADAKAAAATVPVAAAASATPIDPTAAPSAALPVAVPSSKVIAPRVAAAKAPVMDSAPASDPDDAATAASSSDAAAPAAPSAQATDPVTTGSAADAARAAAAVIFGAAPAAAPNAAPDPGTSPADTGLGLTVATVNANQNAAAATLTAAAVKAAVAAVSATVISTATAQDKHGHTSDALSASGATTGPADPTQLGVTSSSAPDASPAATMNVSPHVETPEFGQGVAERVSWMLDNNVSSAKLQVNPPQLGPIEVRIALQGGHAQVWLTSHSAVTRDALESSSPKLREALGAQGFAQVSVDISQRSFQDRPSQPQPYEWTPGAGRGSAASAPLAATPRGSSGVLDAYA